MRVQIHADSVETRELRSLLAALATVGKSETATVGLNGPECWTVTTPHLSPNEFAQVVGQVVKHNGVPLAELIG